MSDYWGTGITPQRVLAVDPAAYLGYVPSLNVISREDSSP
jgi:hypothetical protein